jgi:hypothetical protein
MSLILATWEAEFRRIMVEVSLGKKFLRPHLNEKKKWCVFLPSQLQC